MKLLFTVILCIFTACNSSSKSTTQAEIDKNNNFSSQIREWEKHIPYISHKRVIPELKITEKYLTSFAKSVFNAIKNKSPKLIDNFFINSNDEPNYLFSKNSFEKEQFQFIKKIKSSNQESYLVRLKKQNYDKQQYLSYRKVQKKKLEQFYEQTNNISWKDTNYLDMTYRVGVTEIGSGAGVMFNIDIFIFFSYKNKVLCLELNDVYLCSESYWKIKDQIRFKSKKPSSNKLS